MSRARQCGLSSSLAVACAAAAFLVAELTVAQDSCFERIDNGLDMTGWQRSPTNQHGPGEGWTVEGGAFVGRQTSGQQGGILMTERAYADVEVIFEVKIDWGCDSGFFFRTTDGNRAYQVTIDHLEESGVGTIWGEGFSPQLREIPYWLTDDGNAAIVAPDQDKTPIFDLAQWSSLWNPTDFNEVRASIQGNPPRIQVWISGTQVMDFTDTMLRNEVAASGPLAIQVHSGSRWIADGAVAFKNIRVRDVSVDCEATGDQGSAGSSASTGVTDGAGQTTGAGGGGVTGLGGGAAETGGGQMSGNQVSSGQTSDTGSGGAGGSVTRGDAAAGTSIPSDSGNSSVATDGAAPSSDEGGCGCRLPTHDGRGPTGGLLLLAAAIGHARRRAASSRTATRRSAQQAGCKPGAPSGEQTSFRRRSPGIG